MVRSQAIKTKLKATLLKVPAFITICAMLTRNIPRIFVYHRFTENNDETGRKMSAETFEWQLRWMKKGWKIVSLRDYLKITMGCKKPTSKLVVITVDDGYRDFYEVAYPKLKAAGIEATLFPTVNFVERRMWLWPDRIEYALKNTVREVVEFRFLGGMLNLDLRTSESRQSEWQKLSDFCIDIRNGEKMEFIDRLERELGVATPPGPTAEYCGMAWEEIREVSHNGIEIGSHTINHPILSQVSEEEARREIFESKSILENGLRAQVDTFCYPNGKIADLNGEIVRYSEEAGYIGAVSIESPSASSFDRFRIPRLAVSNDKVDFLWKLSGAEFLVEAAKAHFLKGVVF